MKEGGLEQVMYYTLFVKEGGLEQVMYYTLFVKERRRIGTGHVLYIVC